MALRYPEARIVALLIAGLVLFAGVHFVPSMPALRRGLIARLGEGPYKGIFSLLAAAGVVLMVMGKGRADFVPLWTPPAWGRHGAFALILAGFVLLASAYVPCNVKRFTRHPMLWGICAWSAGHLLANGDLASVILFAGIGAFALVAMVSANIRGATLSTAVRPRSRDAIAAVAGIAAYITVFFLHPSFTGVALNP